MPAAAAAPDLRAREELERRASTATAGNCVANEGQPVPLSNLAADENSGTPQPAQRNSLGRSTTSGELLGGLRAAVPRNARARRARCRCHSASDFCTSQPSVRLAVPPGGLACAAAGCRDLSAAAGSARRVTRRADAVPSVANRRSAACCLVVVVLRARRNAWSAASRFFSLLKVLKVVLLDRF